MSGVKSDVGIKWIKSDLDTKGIKKKKLALIAVWSPSDVHINRAGDIDANWIKTYNSTIEMH